MLPYPLVDTVGRPKCPNHGTMRVKGFTAQGTLSRLIADAAAAVDLCGAVTASATLPVLTTVVGSAGQSWKKVKVADGRSCAHSQQYNMRA